MSPAQSPFPVSSPRRRRHCRAPAGWFATGGRRVRIPVKVLAWLLCAGLTLPAWLGAQPPDVKPDEPKPPAAKENVRGFLYPEEVAESEKKEAAKRRPKPADGKKKVGAGNAGPSRPLNAPPPPALGYTIFSEQGDGRLIRLDPNRKFQTGECVRFLFEPGMDGFLYIIHREETGPAKLIFPDARLLLDRRVLANTAVAIPPENERRYPCFTFKDSDILKARGEVVENLTVILSREDLGSDVAAILERLSAYGREQLDVRADTAPDAGQELSSAEQEAMRNRDASLADAPEASVVVANVGREPLVVARVNLVHTTKK